ncbi:MAG: carboxypeptidase M32 [bacterium JZ-2024 1]
MSAREKYEELRKHFYEVSVLSTIGSLLGWDQRVMMPPGGVKHRAEQIALVEKLIHQKLTDPHIGEWLDAVENSDLVSDPESVEAVNIRWWRWYYERENKIPGEWVEEFARTTTLAEKVWEKAREESNFPLFHPHLKKILDLVRQRAEFLGFEKEPYDALLEDFEPGLSTEILLKLFQPLSKEIPDLLRTITGSGKKPDISILHRHYPREQQESFARMVIQTLGYDWSNGRLDPTVHPFETKIGPGDVRITTRYYEDFLNAALFGAVHETGHALYELGLLPEHFGTPMGMSVSLGIHESQSRMWENFVGRSLPFWEFFYPKAQEYFLALQDVPLATFYFAINEVKPSTIRVEADEVTYNLHILLRFELELALLRKELEVDAVPDFWNEKFQHYFGFRPPSDKEGVLQDVHWSGGMFGYFPTYTLGNIYAAQFFNQAKKEIPELEDLFRKGQFRPFLDWLRTKIHQQGKRYTAPQLVEKVTGTPPDPSFLLTYLKEKFLPLYR